jgi:ABC-type multidrug transport system permease subunit
VFPLKHLLDLINAIYLQGRQVWNEPWDVLIVAAWGALGIAVALRKFRWEPREG